jgi:hypothetical protein
VFENNGAGVNLAPKRAGHTVKKRKEQWQFGDLYRSTLNDSFQFRHHPTSHILFKELKIKIYKTIILLIVLCRPRYKHGYHPHRGTLIGDTRFEVLIMMILKLVFWVLIICGLTCRYQHSGETYCLHLHSQSWRQYTGILVGMLVSTCKSTQCYNPEDKHQHRLKVSENQILWRTSGCKGQK